MFGGRPWMEASADTPHRHPGRRSAHSPFVRPGPSLTRKSEDKPSPVYMIHVSAQSTPLIFQERPQ